MLWGGEDIHTDINICKDIHTDINICKEIFEIIHTHAIHEQQHPQHITFFHFPSFCDLCHLDSLKFRSSILPFLRPSICSVFCFHSLYLSIHMCIYIDIRSFPSLRLSFSTLCLSLSLSVSLSLSLSLFFPSFFFSLLSLLPLSISSLFVIFSSLHLPLFSLSSLVSCFSFFSIFFQFLWLFLFCPSGSVFHFQNPKTCALYPTPILATQLLSRTCLVTLQ